MKKNCANCNRLNPERNLLCQVRTQISQKLRMFMSGGRLGRGDDKEKEKSEDQKNEREKFVDFRF